MRLLGVARSCPRATVAPATRATATAVAATLQSRRAGRRRIGSAEVAGDVFLGQLLARGLEDLLRRADLDQVPRAAALRDVDGEERGDVGNALGLLHVVRHDGDRVLLLELEHEL